jgi:hypothetical protein
MESDVHAVRFKSIEWSHHGSTWEFDAAEQARKAISGHTASM